MKFFQSPATPSLLCANIFLSTLQLNSPLHNFTLDNYTRMRKRALPPTHTVLLHQDLPETENFSPSKLC